MNLLENFVRIEKVKFSRPNNDDAELGLRIEREDGRSIIIDKDFNIVINCAYHNYGSCLLRTNLTEFE